MQDKMQLSSDLFVTGDKSLWVIDPKDRMQSLVQRKLQYVFQYFVYLVNILWVIAFSLFYIALLNVQRVCIVKKIYMIITNISVS